MSTRRSTSWGRMGMIGAAILIALAAWIGCIRSDGSNDFAKQSLKSNRTHAVATTGLIDGTSPIASSAGGGWQLAKANIEDIRVGMRVPAHNPQLLDEDRAAEQFTVDPKTWRTFKLTVDKEDGTGDLEVTLLRPASWLVDELDCTALLALMSEFENGSGGLSEPNTPESSWQRGARWVNEVSQIDPLSELSSLAADATTLIDANRLSSIANPGLLFAGELAGAVQSERLALANAELDYASAIDSFLGGDGIGSQIYLELPELGAVGIATVTAIEPCPRIKDGPGQIVTATFKHASAKVLDLRFSPVSSSSLRSTASSLTLGVTAAHPFWSFDREDFIPAGELQRGEQVVGIDGQHFRLTSITVRAGPETVYNFEVAIDHVYYVGDGGLLVHNGCSFFVKALKNSGGRIKNAFSNGFKSISRVRGAGKKLACDHRLPQELIQSVSRAARATNDQKRRINLVMDSAQNLKVMERSLNSSKGMRNMAAFAKTPLGRGTTAAFRQGIARTQRNVANKINDILNERTVGRPIDWFSNFFD